MYVMLYNDEMRYSLWDNSSRALQVLVIFVIVERNIRRLVIGNQVLIVDVMWKVTSEELP